MVKKTPSSWRYIYVFDGVNNNVYCLDVKGRLATKFKRSKPRNLLKCLNENIKLENHHEKCDTQAAPFLLPRVQNLQNNTNNFLDHENICINEETELQISHKFDENLINDLASFDDIINDPNKNILQNEDADLFDFFDF